MKVGNIELESEIKKDIEPLCNISVTKNTKDFNYHISVYQGCTNDMIDDVIMKSFYGVKGIHAEIKALKRLEESG